MIELGFSSYRSLYFAFASYLVFGQIALWLEFHPFKVNKWMYQGSNPDPCILQAMFLPTKLCSLEHLQHV
jgi:hypothetical protein